MSSTLGACGHDGRGQQSREDGRGQSEEQEQHPRVRRVAACGAECGAEVVTHECAADAAGFKIPGRAADLGEGRTRIVRQRVVEGRVDLDADQVTPDRR